MAAYLIARKDINDLETLIFSGDEGDGVPVFTDQRLAQQYIDAAGWQDEYTVATLEAIDFLEWLIQVHRAGVKFMATDPTRAEHEAGARVNSLDIESQLQHAGEHVTMIANPDF